MITPEIDILLATYNGATFLDEQLQSLAAQDFANWRLIVRDDGSSDTTLAMVENFASHVSQPVEIVRDSETGLGASRNFGRILQRSTAPYFAFCDQDDVWLPHKLSTMRSAIRSAEERAGGQVPVLSHCDLEVVDEKLRLIAPSFRRFSKLRTPHPGEEGRYLMMQNYVTGCAMMGNAVLREKSLPIPDVAMMHDWWLALVAAGTGELVEVGEPLIRYRQHGRNTLGAKSAGLRTYVTRFATRPAKELTRGRAIVARTRAQAVIFADRFDDQADPELVSLLRAYGRTSGQSFFKRKGFVLRNRLFAQDIIRIAAMALVI